MKSCKNCKDRQGCASICPDVERLLPKDGTGKDSHKEINLDTEAFLAAVEKYSYSDWHYLEVSSKKIELDLSVLSPKEKAAFRLLASGLTQRAAARRLKLHPKSFQKRVNKGREKLLGRHISHLIEGENKPGGRTGGGKI